MTAGCLLTMRHKWKNWLPKYKHYHVIPAVEMVVPLASTTFENYEDSLETYVRLSTELFAHALPLGDLAIEHARDATGDGEALGSCVGNEALAIVWLRCDGDCASGTWN